ncbi:class II histone deacetylase [Lutimaribacter saemankumensis]|uniref:Acetoin utilization deacetylase AcuC n=1 Tax=Lutimaribacter saemankumensis TaxID=490829 RepID=A0A1G8T5U3_9RHOB|nr:class II histone deacetylase [Lutimaribacter saemankumensis]SDJ36908.1 Acetoin utilization deacetylase AcuC [Lutimaribacter saemankumensis]
MAKGSKRTGWVYSEIFNWHDTGRYNMLWAPSLSVQPGQHVENEETKRRFYNLLEVSQLAEHVTRIRPRPATDKELLRFHTPAHLAHLQQVCDAGGGEAGGKTHVGAASFDIARLAAGGVLEAVDAVIEGRVDNAYVLCRPPGHHAEAELVTGFCLLANGVLGVKHAREVHGLKRIAVVDWDVHHGNGAETAFLDDPDVLTISLHQDNLFPPDRGGFEVVGGSCAQGSNINVPLPPGSGSGAYRAAFDQIVVPALEQFAPEMIFVASGFDAAAMDPLGHMMLSSEDFHYMAECLLKVADQFCAGRIVMTHEGGYSAGYVPYCGLAVIEAMTGRNAGIEDPFRDYIVNYGAQDLQPHQQAAIDAVLLTHQLKQAAE